MVKKATHPNFGTQYDENDPVLKGMNDRILEEKRVCEFFNDSKNSKDLKNVVEKYEDYDKIYFGLLKAENTRSKIASAWFVYGGKESKLQRLNNEIRVLTQDKETIDNACENYNNMYKEPIPIHESTFFQLIKQKCVPVPVAVATTTTTTGSEGGSEKLLSTEEIDVTINGGEELPSVKAIHVAINGEEGGSAELPSAEAKYDNTNGSAELPSVKAIHVATNGGEGESSNVGEGGNMKLQNAILIPRAPEKT